MNQLIELIILGTLGLGMAMAWAAAITWVVMKVIKANRKEPV